ncbi:MAG: alpha/beta fold hydrolase [Candidatus Riflebacteria bacterium]|nr:alpha/beta fold hydrolase [Candidatus Riflebacteria bacterium]
MAQAPDPAVGLDQSAVAAFDSLKQYHQVPGFRIGGRYDLSDESSYELGGSGGVTFESLGLPPVQLGYVTVGTPHRNGRGEVDNAVLICPYYSGDSTNMLDFWSEKGTRTDLSEGAPLGPGKVFDTDRYYFILADALGLWGTSKPSSSHPGQPGTRALGLAFPQYRLEDCVQLMYRLLRDRLGVDRLRLVTGVSLGASLTYVWGVLHPTFAQALCPIGGTPFQNRGMARWLFDLMTAAIQSDPIYRMTRGDYYARPRLERPILGNLFGWSLLRQSAYVDERRVAQSEDQYTLESFDWEGSQAVVDSLVKHAGAGQALFSVALIDSNDLIYRNRAQAVHDVEGELGRIRARTLIVHVETDQWLRPHIARRAHERIPGSRLITFPHDLGHYAVFAAPIRYAGAIRELLEAPGPSAR